MVGGVSPLGVIAINSAAAVRILFVCLGNICRSPLAEGIARSVLAQAGRPGTVASCGTGNWHVGEGADQRSLQVAAEAGYDLSRHRVRQLAASDYPQYDLLLAMDRNNLAELQRQAPEQYRERVHLFLPWAGITDSHEVPDPYYGNLDDFRQVRSLLERAMRRRWLTGSVVDPR